MDNKLDFFSQLDVLVDYDKTYTRRFTPDSLTSDTKVVHIFSDDGYLEPRSLRLVVSGRFVLRTADGEEKIVPPLQRTKRLIVSVQTSSSSSSS